MPSPKPGDWPASDPKMGLKDTVGRINQCGCCGGPNAHYAYKMVTTDGIILFCEKHLDFFRACAGTVGEVMG